MKRILIIALLFSTLGLGILGAQEISGFQASFVDKRYEISFSIPGGSASGRYDLFIYTRLVGSEAWAKASTILGDFRNLPVFHNGKIFWDPFFDYRKEGNYEFRLYAVPLQYVKSDYNYTKVTQVGMLRVFSDQSAATYRLNGKDILSTDRPALPVGDYEVSLLQNGVVIETRTVSILPFQYTETDLSPRFGNLTLSCNLSGALYAIGDGSFSDQASHRLKTGTYKVKVNIPQSNSAYPSLSAQADVVVEHGRENTYRFEVPYGTLSLSADLDRVSYQLLGKDFQDIQGMMLSPGSVEVRAISDDNTARITQIMNRNLTITNGATTTHSFNFKDAWGFLSVSTPSPASFVTVNGFKLTPGDAFKVPEGIYKVTAVMPDGKIFGPTDVKVQPGQISVHNFGVDPDVNLDVVKVPKSSKKSKTEIFKWPLSDISLLGVLSDANRFPNPDAPSDSLKPNKNQQDLALGISAVGVIETKMMRNMGNLHYFWSVGVLDQLYFMMDTRSNKTSFATDAVSLGGGAGVKAFGERMYFELSFKGSLSTQTPLYRTLTLFNPADTTNVKYRYAVSLKVDRGDKTIHTANNLEWGGAFQAKAKLQYRFSKLANFYAFAAWRLQTENSGKWYRDDELTAWENDGSLPKPATVSDLRFPTRNVIFSGESLIFGLGFSLVAW